jgi:hypothetical protein
VDAGKTNPTGLTCGVAIRYKDSEQNKPKPVIFRAIYLGYRPNLDFGHNYNLWGRVIDELQDDQLRKYCNAVAWHGYAGTPDMMSKVQEAFGGSRCIGRKEARTTKTRAI